MTELFYKIFGKKNPNLYHKRKEKISSNPAIAFFQQPASLQKKEWKQIIREANEMQRKIMEI